MPRTPRSSRRASAAASAVAAATRSTPEPRMVQLEEEAEHERQKTMQHGLLVLEKLENLRGLVKEIKQDDWKHDPKERLPNHVTKSLAWKQSDPQP